jgi:hypothetical protein
MRFIYSGCFLPALLPSVVPLFSALARSAFPVLSANRFGDPAEQGVEFCLVCPDVFFEHRRILLPL